MLDAGSKLALSAPSGFLKKLGEKLFDFIEKKAFEPRDLAEVIKINFDKTYKSVNNVKILGMTQPVPIEKIYYPTRVSSAIRRRLYENTWTKISKGDLRKQLRRDASTTESGLDAAKKTKRIVILGGPGSGKTTFLKYLALSHANEEMFSKSKLQHRLTPIFIHLPLLSESSESIFDYICRDLQGDRGVQLKRAIEALLERGEAIILLDSLDEVPISQRAAAVKKIAALFKRFHNISGVVSCRTADYSQTIENFTEFEVARLEKAAIEHIVRGWFEADAEISNSSARADQLLKIIEENEDVEILAETPLLLSLICIQYSYDLRIPHRKVELYRRCLEALLSRWDSSRNFRRDSKFEHVLTDDRKERLLEFLSEAFYASKRQYVLSENEMNESVGLYCEEKFQLLRTDAASIVDELERHHGLVERYSVDSFCFSHPSFQEYFYARRLDRRGATAAKISGMLKDASFSPVIEFLVSLKEDPSDLIEKMISSSRLDNIKNYPAMTLRIRHLVILHRCLVSGPAIGRKFAGRIYTHIYDSLRNILRIFRESSIYPLPELRADGIRHIYFLGEKGRQTLDDALLHLRILSNEILRTPHEGLADFMLARALEAEPGTNIALLKTFECACVILPLASAKPIEVGRYLETLSEKDKPHDTLAKFHENSLKVLKQKYMPK